MSLGEFSAGTFDTWFQDMVVKGNAGEDNEKAGTLEFLDQTMKSWLLTIYFNALSVFRFTPEPANAAAIKRVEVEMYCEQKTLTPVKI